MKSSALFSRCFRKLLHSCGTNNGACRFHSSPRAACPKSGTTDLLQQLKSRIKATGPITVAEYMKEVLTNPVSGYYMHKDVFGEKGDFITSPEISQMFGELLGVWCVHEWMNSGSPTKVQLVELGPGRGTLADDMLRVFSQFGEIRDAVSVHLVEVSPKLSDMQREKLSGDSAVQVSGDKPYYNCCHSKYCPEIFWYRSLTDVPRNFTFFIAHEFFDALPIHKFQKKDGRWLEVMIDADDDAATEHHLRYVLSPGSMPASTLLIKDALSEGDTREHVEVCPEAGLIVQELANRVEIDGGFALFADYGHNGDKTDTFRAFKQHKLHDALAEPGTADLTADVDFAYLKRMVSNRASSYGPITQTEFLTNMGIGYRIQALMGQASPEQRKSLISGYDMMTNPSKMGDRFKFLALSRHKGKEYLPAGFKPLS